MKPWPLLMGLWASGAFSQDRVSLVFDEIPLVDLARIAYGEIAQLPVIFTHDAVQARDTVTLSLKNIERRQAVSQVEELLVRSGLKPERRAGVVWIAKTLEPERNEYFYRPRYRSVSYLVDLLAPVFKQGAFTLQRGMQQPQVTNSGPGIGQGQGQGHHDAPVDNGSSVYSMMDKKPDAFIFRGETKDQGRLVKLLAQIDTPTPELLVKAVIYEVVTDKTDKSALALALSILGGKLQLGKVAAGDFSAVVKLAKLEGVLDVLSTDSRFKVVSSPTLRVKSGEKARLTVGTETPILGTAQLDKNGNPIQSVEYRPSGVILDLNPEIREDITDLRVSQQISNFISTTNGVNNSPTLIKRELTTAVGVKSGDVLVLGGLDEDKRNEDKRGVPWLPAWLGSSGKSETKTEVLLILEATRI